MTDYRKIFGVSDLSVETNDGEGIKVAVLDTGIPHISEILVCLSDNLTNYGDSDSGHATFIGSLLFGRGDIIGVCKNATACFMKVFDGIFSKPDIIAKAIRHAVDIWRVDIINMSLGFSRQNDCPKSLREACQYAVSKGVTLVAAAGNDGGETLWPAALPEVISVGSTDGTNRENFSNYGKIDFVVNGRDLIGYTPEGSTTNKTGTSFSTAIITGMLTLLIAKRRKYDKKIDPDSLKQDLISVCSDIGPTGYDTDTGFGIPFYKASNKSFIHRLSLLIRPIYAKIRKMLKSICIFNTEDKL